MQEADPLVICHLSCRVWTCGQVRIFLKRILNILALQFGNSFSGSHLSMNILGPYVSFRMHFRIMLADVSSTTIIHPLPFCSKLVENTYVCTKYGQHTAQIGNNLHI
jgi:hypothetical protein